MNERIDKMIHTHTVRIKTKVKDDSTALVATPASKFRDVTKYDAARIKNKTEKLFFVNGQLPQSW